MEEVFPNKADMFSSEFPDAVNIAVNSTGRGQSSLLLHHHAAAVYCLTDISSGAGGELAQAPLN